MQTSAERYVLSAYYFDGWTLKQIAATLGVHESSVQRRIRRSVNGIRKYVVRYLQRAGMSSRQIEDCFQADSMDLSIDIRGLLLRNVTGE